MKTRLIYFNFLTRRPSSLGTAAAPDSQREKRLAEHAVIALALPARKQPASKQERLMIEKI
ncbi:MULTISPECIES: hypothetical protein [unclassified Pseudomonas]|uniref:hypothetical protein n=1 Tax=unclassified Pseudomonas TaxID=196821 RepID=UPI0032668027